MTEQQRSGLKDIEPISTWSDEDEPQGSANARTPTGQGEGLEPIPGTPGATSLVDDAGKLEPRTSPETDQELDQLRRG